MILEDAEFSQIQARIPRFIVQNCLSLKESRKIFHACLLSSNHQISISAWLAVKEYICNLDNGTYYEVQQYGSLSYWPGSSADEVLGFSEFFEKLELLSDSTFLSIIDDLRVTLNSYLHLYYSDQYYSGYGEKDLLSETRKNNSEKARVLFLNLFERRNDLLSFEEELQNILEEDCSKSRIASEIRSRVLQKLSQLKSAAA